MTCLEEIAHDRRYSMMFKDGVFIVITSQKVVQNKNLHPKITQKICLRNYSCARYSSIEHFDFIWYNYIN